MRRTLPLLATAALAACAPSTPRATTTAAAAQTPISTASTPGAQTCLELSQIRETQVRDDQTIDFILRNGQVLRNTLPYRCPQLGFERAFTYSTSISRLCNVDIITVINQGGGVARGASCGLGVFVPYTPPPRS